MSRRRKLEKFEDLLSFSNVYQNFDPKHPELVGMNKLKTGWCGNWGQHHFKNDHPLVLELACGKGDYCLALALRYPQKNFVGVDIKGSRIWKGAKQALTSQLSNVAFLRTRIEQLGLFFSSSEVSEIWITFPDPFPRKSKVNRRLSSDNFLEVYQQIMVPGGLIHLKTDAKTLYEYSLDNWSNSKYGEIILHDPDIYSHELAHPDLDIHTFYEKMHLEDQRPITYIQFRVKGIT